jgi:hypothetical protein
MLPDADMQGWIKTCEAEEEAGRRMSTRRLRKSLALGRVATVAGASCARPYAGRLAPRLPYHRQVRPLRGGRMTSRFPATATREQRFAMKRDLEPIINIYNQPL